MLKGFTLSKIVVGCVGEMMDVGRGVMVALKSLLPQGYESFM